MPEGYCVKERKKVEIKDPQQVTMKNGRPAIQGTCPDCGTKIFKIGKLEADHAAPPAPGPGRAGIALKGAIPPPGGARSRRNRPLRRRYFNAQATFRSAVGVVAAVPCRWRDAAPATTTATHLRSSGESSRRTAGERRPPGGQRHRQPTDFKLNPSDPTVKSGDVTFNATNDGQTSLVEVEADRRGPGARGHAARPEGHVTVNLPPGTYEWYCPIANHKDLGMKGEITVK